MRNTMKYKLALIGFGLVGQGICEILVKKQDYLKDKYDFEWEVTGISDINIGSMLNTKGLDLKKLLTLVKETGTINEYPDGIKGLDSLETIKKSNADIIIEVSYSDFKTGEPALTYCKTALQLNKHVVTANKGPAALAYGKLKKLADEHNIKFMIEGTVVSGTPVINLAKNGLAGNTITAIKGILNGSTNFILTEMEKGKNYEEAVTEAYNLGYLEEDTTADVEGYDALTKVVILAKVIMNADIKPGDVVRKGITGITPDDIEKARKEGKKWKLIGSVIKNGDSITVSVQPEELPLEHPLASIDGTTNAVTFSTDLLGDVTVIGPGAGRLQTGYSILTDILEIHRLSI